MTDYEALAREFLVQAKGRPLSVDTETTDAKKYDIRDGTGYAVGVSVAFKNDDGTFSKHYFPFRHKIGDNYDRSLLIGLKELIENTQFIVFHNAKYDLVSLTTLGINYKNMWYDTMILAYLINENWPASKSLENVSKYYLGAEYGKEKSDEFINVVAKFGWEAVSVELMRKYAEMDAELPLRLIEVLMPKYKKEVVNPEYWDWKRRFIECVIVMESRGVRIDQDYCRRMADIADTAMSDYYEHMGGYNPASPKDMKELLCDKLGLPPIFKENFRKNKETGAKEMYVSQTFNNEAMAEYELMLEGENSDLAQYVLGYRGWSKAASSFYRAYLNHVSPDGRVRPRYHHHKDDKDGGTVTGRLSCSEPNLQQIPRESTKPWNGGVKEAFVGQEGYSLWEVDFSQLELRLATAYAREQSLIEVFNDPSRDIFTEIAKSINQLRQTTKTFVYMTQYGAGDKRVARIIKITLAAAKDLRAMYYSTYPGFVTVNNKVKRIVMGTKKIKLWSGRHRHFNRPKDDAHKAFNSLIQGGSADIVERQMVRIFEQIDQTSNDECRMLLTVHDSVWFEIKDGTEENYVPRIEALMADVGALSDDGFEGVKFAVEAKRVGAK